MFSAETITEFRKRFRELPQAQFDSLLAWVDTRDANNPSALLESQLKRATEEHRANPAGKGNTQPGDSRGSLRPDGSWDRTLVFASATERLLREYCATVCEKHLSPAQAVDLIAMSPALASTHRAGAWQGDSLAPAQTTGGPIGVMQRLDATPTRDGFTNTRWIHAAWIAVHTSTSAEEFAKRTIVDLLETALAHESPPRHESHNRNVGRHAVALWPDDPASAITDGF